MIEIPQAKSALAEGRQDRQQGSLSLQNILKLAKTKVKYMGTHIINFI